MRAELASPTVEQSRLLIVRSPGDEASGTLGFFQFVSHFTVRLYVRVFSLYERLETAAHEWAKRKAWMLAVAAACLFVFIGLVLFATDPSWGPAIGSWVRAGLVAGAFLALLIALEATLLALGGAEMATVFLRLAASAVVWPVIALLWLLLLPFGREVALANILLDVTAESTPPGSWSVHLIEPPTTGELGRDMLPLMHSVVYENPQFLNLICDWITRDDGALAEHCQTP